ncbi:hypothetical protein HMPREF9946_03981 [Acetobacteraceae bacterium AT-5844]|nr:hypothetical protein HMPREF9946_03981 [Acetobacteraceae bacterium AT-5844]
MRPCGQPQPIWQRPHGSESWCGGCGRWWRRRHGRRDGRERRAIMPPPSLEVLAEMPNGFL